MKIKISAISYHLPDNVEGAETLKRDNPDWDMEKIIEKTGILKRHISSSSETALDLATKAAKKLLDSINKYEKIDLLILVTQSPDYVLPTSACILQDRLGLKNNCMAFDINLGCSGYVYALSIAGGLIESCVANNGLIVCADTYTKYIRKNDRTSRPLFSDGAAATLVEKSDVECIGPFELGTDGSGFDRLIVTQSGAKGSDHTDIEKIDDSCQGTLQLYGSDVFLFSLRVVPNSINKLLKKTGLKYENVDLFVFHQASKLIIDNLVRTMSLDKNKVYVNYENIGNTVSASIPIALKDADSEGRLKDGDTILLVGFGVGLSWGASLIRWSVT